MASITLQSNIEVCPGAIEPRRIKICGHQITSFFVGRFNRNLSRIKYDVWLTFTGKKWIFRVYTAKGNVFNRFCKEYEMGDTIYGTTWKPVDSYALTNILRTSIDIDTPNNAYMKAYRHAANLQLPGTEFHKWIGPHIENTLPTVTDIRKLLESDCNEDVGVLSLGKHLIFNTVAMFGIRKVGDMVLRFTISLSDHVFSADICLNAVTNEYVFLNFKEDKIRALLPMIVSREEGRRLLESSFVKAFEELFWNPLRKESSVVKERTNQTSVLAKEQTMQNNNKDCSTMSTTIEDNDEFVYSNECRIYFEPSKCSFAEFCKARSRFVKKEAATIIAVGEPHEFIGRVIWFDSEADLWIFKRTFIKSNTEFGFKLIAPDKGIESIGQESEIIEEFIIPESSLELCTELNRLGPKRQKATVQLIAFIKQCKLADTFLRENDIH